MAEHTDSNVPQIRFKGFEGEWVEKELGELFPITSAARVHKNEWTKSGVPFFRSSDVVSNFKGNDNTKAFISHELYEELSAKVGRIKKGDMLVTGGGSIGVPYLVESDEPLYFKDADLLWFKIREAVDSNYLYTFFSSQLFTRYVKSISHIGTIAHYTVEQAKSTPLTIPEENAEQTQIGGYFKELDGMIGLHQRKHGKLVTLKQAMLQKMFPQNGATTPEIRFKGFSEPWVEKTVEEVSNRYDNLRIPISAVNRIAGKTPYYGANGIQGYVEGFTHEGEFILIAEDGANDLKNYPVQYVRGKIWVNNHAHVLQAKSGLADTQFLGHSFSQQDIEQCLVGGGRAKLNANTMMKIVVSLPPNVSEQQKIGTYFRQLDTLIAKHATQLEKLKQLKSACLEKMFV
jgi:type I restriction enzyme, S subunit